MKMKKVLRYNYKESRTFKHKIMAMRIGSTLEKISYSNINTQQKCV
jgi:hypothetical protein